MITKLTDIPKLDSKKLELKDYNVVDWFEVHLFRNGCIIKSGLRHSDGETKSPFHYEGSFWGDDYEEKALKHFNNFLKEKGYE